MGMKWSTEYNTGIEVIDDQHRRILDYINEIADLKYSHDRVKMKSVLDNIIDYTQSHFTFEESLQEEANYKYRVPHKRVHDLFIKKIEAYRERFELGHEIGQSDVELGQSDANPNLGGEPPGMNEPSVEPSPDEPPDEPLN